MKMRKLIYVLCLLSVLCACSKKAQYNQPLGLMSEVNVLSSDGGMTPVPVFSNTSWTASFNTPVSWASLDRLGGSGCDQVKFYYESNYGRSRKVTLHFVTAEKSLDLLMFQKAGISDDDVVMTFPIVSGNYDKLARSVEVPFTTNLYSTDEFVYEVDYPGDDKGWLSNFRYANGNICFNMNANTGVSERTATISIAHTDAGSSYDAKSGTTLHSNTFTITQSQD